MKWVKTSWWDKTNKNSKFSEKVIWFGMWEKIFFSTFLVLRVCTCIKVGVLFYFILFLVWEKYQRIVHNRPTSKIFFKEPGGATAPPRPKHPPPPRVMGIKINWLRTWTRIALKIRIKARITKKLEKQVSIQVWN